MVYPEEREGRTKNANKKLKNENRALNKKIRRLQSENKTLQRAFNKSCSFMEEKLKDYSLDQIIQMIDDFKYKETEKGRRKKEENVVEQETLILNNCPKCGKNEGDGYVVLSYQKFKVQSCQCGFKSKVDNDEGIERS